jgi:hypothetical protein
MNKKNMHDGRRNGNGVLKQSTGRGVFVRVSAELRVEDVMGPAIALSTVKMRAVQNAIEHFAHGVGRIRRAVALEEGHQSLLHPFLGCEKLQVHVLTLADRASMM